MLHRIPGSIKKMGSSSVASSPPIDVFAIGGQSNAQGQGGDATLSPIVPVGKVLQYSSGSISAGNDPVGNASPSSAWPAFGVVYNEATGRPVLFVPSASGGSNQSASATVGTTHWDLGGALAPALIANVTAAMAAARAAGYTPTYRGILWCEGENPGGQIGDNPVFPALGSTTATGGPYAAGSTSITVASATGISINETLVITLDNGTTYPSNISNVVGTTATLSVGVPTSRNIPTGANLRVYCKADYRTDLVNMLNYFRTTTTDGTTFPQLPFYISLTGQPQGGTNAELGYLKVRQAQEEVAASDPYTRVVYRGAQDFTVRNMMQSGSLHYLQEGYNEMGREMARGIVSAQSEGFWTAKNYNVHRITLGGTVRGGDAWNVTVTQANLVGTPWAVTGSVGGTLALTAASIASTSNVFSPNLAALGIFFTAAGNVVTMYQPAALVPQATVAATWTTGGSTETFTITTGAAAYGSSPGAEKWPTYPPVLTPNVGSVTTGGTAGFLQINKMAFVNINATITAISGGPATVTLNLPVAPLRDLALIGYEGGNTGKIIRAAFAAGSTTSISIRDATAAVFTPALNDEYKFTNSYEVA